MSFETLGYETGDGVGLVTLARPERMNALSATMLDELQAVLRASLDDGTRVLVVTGGPDVFSVGADLKDAGSEGSDARTPLSTARGVQRTMALFDAMARHPAPIIAAVGGMALGGGAELALACDIRIAAEDASFGFPEVKLGILPGAGGTQRLTRLAGTGRALELLLTGDPVDARRAEQLGIVNQVVANDQLLPAARDLAAKLARRPPVAVAVIKQVVRAGADASLQAGLTLEAEAAALLMGTADAREGIRAFLEKRRPDFQGR